MKQLYALVVLIVLTFAASPAVFSQLTKKSSVFGSSPFSKVDKIKPVQTVTPEVVFGAVDAYTDGNGVFVRWNTTSEVENIGFSVTRTQKGVTEKVGNFVLGSFAHYGKEPVSGETYSVFDPSGTSDAVYAVQ